MGQIFARYHSVLHSLLALANLLVSEPVTFSWVCRIFEDVAVYCETYNNLIPVAFILGFYVSLVVGRFWEQLNLLPWPHRLAVFVSSLVQGNDDRGRLLRRTILRYANLAYLLTMRSICFATKKRFPSLDVVTEAGNVNNPSLILFEWSSQSDDEWMHRFDTTIFYRRPISVVRKSVFGRWAFLPCAQFMVDRWVNFVGKLSAVG